MQKLSVILFTTKNGKEPLVQWLNSLKNKKDRAGIQRRIQYIENGNLEYTNLGFSFLVVTEYILQKMMYI